MYFGTDFVSDLLRFCREILEARELETVLELLKKLGALQRIPNLLGAQKKTLLFNSVI